MHLCLLVITLQQEVRNCEDKMIEIEKESQEIKEKANYWHKKCIEDADLRRELSNQVTELKGNIRVMCRIRPKLDGECDDNEAINHTLYHYPDGDLVKQTIDVIEPSIKSFDGCRDISKKHSFSYNRVFDHSASQDMIFDEIASFIQSCIDGYKVSYCISLLRRLSPFCEAVR